MPEQNEIIALIGTKGNIPQAQSESLKIARASQAVFDKNPLRFKSDFSALNKGLVDSKKQFNQLTEASVDFGDSLERGVRRIVALSAASSILFGVAKGLEAALKAGKDLEKTLADINVVLNLPTSGIKRFGSDLFDVARDTRQSFEEVSKSALEFSRQGLSVEETLKRTRAALILTNLAGIDSVKSTEAITAAVNSFSKENLNAIDIVNKLVAVDARFAISSADLAEAITRVGSTAQDVGVSFDKLISVTTAAQQVTQRGGSTIGNALKTIFQRLQRQDTIEALEKLGVQVREVDNRTGSFTGNLISADQVLRQLGERFKTLTQEQKAQTSELVAGVFQGNIFRGILSGLSIEQEAYRASLQSTDEAIQRNNTLLKTQDAQLKTLGTTLQQAGANFAQIGFGDAFKSSLDFLNDNFIVKAISGQGDEAGKEFGRVFIKSVSDILLGPGLIAIAAFALKAIGATANVITSSFQSAFGVGQKTLSLQEQITKFINAQGAELIAINATTNDRATKERLILELFAQQTFQLAQQKILVAETSALLKSSGGPIINKGNIKIRNAANGVPDALHREALAIRQGVGGASATAKPVFLPSVSVGGSKGVVANTDEFIVPNFAGSGAAIFNQDMVKSFGLPKGAKRIGNYAGGVSERQFGLESTKAINLIPGTNIPQKGEVSKLARFYAGLGIAPEEFVPAMRLSLRRISSGLDIQRGLKGKGFGLVTLKNLNPRLNAAFGYIPNYADVFLNRSQGRSFLQVRGSGGKFASKTDNQEFASIIAEAAKRGVPLSTITEKVKTSGKISLSGLKSFVQKFAAPLNILTPPAGPSTSFSGIVKQPQEKPATRNILEPPNVVPKVTGVFPENFSGVPISAKLARRLEGKGLQLPTTSPSVSQFGGLNVRALKSSPIPDADAASGFLGKTNKGLIIASKSLGDNATLASKRFDELARASERVAKRLEVGSISIDRANKIQDLITKERRTEVSKIKDSIAIRAKDELVKNTRASKLGSISNAGLGLAIAGPLITELAGSALTSKTSDRITRERQQRGVSQAATGLSIAGLAAQLLPALGFGPAGVIISAASIAAIGLAVGLNTATGKETAEETAERLNDLTAVTAKNIEALQASEQSIFQLREALENGATPEALESFQKSALQSIRGVQSPQLRNALREQIISKDFSKATEKQTNELKTAFVKSQERNLLSSSANISTSLNNFIEAIGTDKGNDIGASSAVKSVFGVGIRTSLEAQNRQQQLEIAKFLLASGPNGLQEVGPDVNLNEFGSDSGRDAIIEANKKITEDFIKSISEELGPAVAASSPIQGLFDEIRKGGQASDSARTKLSVLLREGSEGLSEFSKELNSLNNQAKVATVSSKQLSDRLSKISLETIFGGGALEARKIGRIGGQQLVLDRLNASGVNPETIQRTTSRFNFQNIQEDAQSQRFNLVRKTVGDIASTLKENKSQVLNKNAFSSPEALKGFFDFLDRTTSIEQISEAFDDLFTVIKEDATGPLSQLREKFQEMANETTRANAAIETQTKLQILQEKINQRLNTSKTLTERGQSFLGLSPKSKDVAGIQPSLDFAQRLSNLGGVNQDIADVLNDIQFKERRKIEKPQQQLALKRLKSLQDKGIKTPQELLEAATLQKENEDFLTQNRFRKFDISEETRRLRANGKLGELDANGRLVSAGQARTVIGPSDISERAATRVAGQAFRATAEGKLEEVDIIGQLRQLPGEFGKSLADELQKVQKGISEDEKQAKQAMIDLAGAIKDNPTLSGLTEALNNFSPQGTLTAQGQITLVADESIAKIFEDEIAPLKKIVGKLNKKVNGIEFKFKTGRDAPPSDDDDIDAHPDE